MKEQTDKKAVLTEDKIKRSAVVTVISDVVLIVALVLCLFAYTSRNNVNTYNQNVKTITGIASAESELMLSALDSTRYEVISAYNYCTGKSMEDILDYLALVNSSGGEYQLLKRDEINSTDLYHIYYGYSTLKVNGKYRQVQYDDTSLSKALFNNSSLEEGKIAFSQSFTNNTDALRYFAVFCSMQVEEDGVSQRYYLVRPQKESRVLDQLKLYSQYIDPATAICYSNGKYLACDDNFRSDNFYDYLYKYNDLSIDERNAIKASVQNDPDGIGDLTYKDYKGRDCVFAYASCGENNDWFIIISVPRSEFVSEKLLSFFPLIIITFLVILLAFNVWRLLVIVQELRGSVERERIANSSKSSFLSRMSHEIRTPLNAVIGYNIIARNAMAEAESDTQHRQAEMKAIDCLTKSDVASKHLLTIINDVLDMSAIDSGKIQIVHEKFDFKGLITSLTTVFYSQAKSKNVDFEVIFDTFTEEWFVGDQLRVNQVLTNLLSNAIKFTPEGGSVVLKISQPEAETNSSHIHFEVSDTGIGMTDEYMSHIWTPFEQADSSISRRFGGTGLGLSITKSLVDLMCGSIIVESTVGLGTTFKVDLTFERTDQPLSNALYDFSAVNALIVDDDHDTCDYIKLLFNRCGAKCATVTSGQDALKAISIEREHGGHFSLCIVDWQMPGMDGLETCDRIRELTGPEMPLIVLTAYDYTELADKASNAGVDRFLSKPLFQSSLFDLLANVCGTKTCNDKSTEDNFDFSGTHILLAEDNAMNMEIAKTILESAGFIVDSAWNGKEAVALFENAPAGTYAAILMDVHMPEMNGHDATRAIRASTHPDAASMPIIAMTADAFAENVAEALDSGMNDHISKPIDVSVLFETLKRYI